MLKRQRMGSDEFVVQEVDGMYMVKVYCSLDELNNKIKEKLSDVDREKFKDSTFLPIKIGMTENDFTIEALFAATR